jgi:hypothetical protein
VSLPPAQAERLIDALRELGRPPTLTAPRAVIREAVLVAIDEIGEAVSAASTSLLRGHGASADELRETIAELGGLLDLLDTIDYRWSR